MKNDFCTEYIAACDEQIDLPVYGNPEFGEVDYCTMHTGGGDEDLFWSYPYELSEWQCAVRIQPEGSKFKLQEPGLSLLHAIESLNFIHYITPLLVMPGLLPETKI